MIFKILLKPIFTVELINDQHIHHQRFSPQSRHANTI